MELRQYTPQQEHLSSRMATGASDTGQVRTHNEDTFLLCEPDNFILGNLYILADGAGGHVAGEIASRLAANTIAHTYYTPLPEKEAPTHQGQMKQLQGPLTDLQIPLRHLLQAFFLANEQLQRHILDHPEHSGMATTCVAAAVKGRQMVIAHVGDSRAYLIHPVGSSDKALHRLTVDHSLAEALLQAKVLSAEEVAHTSTRHILTRALGGHKQQAVDPDITTCLAQPGDRLLLCCDGLWSMVSEEQMLQVVHNNTPQAACQELLRLANEAGGEDNITVVIISFP